MRLTVLCLINTALMVTGQILFKIGSRGRTLASVKDILVMMFSPVILLALCIYAGTTVLWLFILNKAELSFAYPIQALAFPAVLLISSLIFHENIPLNRWLGVGIIFLGVYIAIYK